MRSFTLQEHTSWKQSTFHKKLIFFLPFSKYLPKGETTVNNCTGCPEHYQHLLFCGLLNNLTHFFTPHVHSTDDKDVTRDNLSINYVQNSHTFENVKHTCTEFTHFRIWFRRNSNNTILMLWCFSPFHNVLYFLSCANLSFKSKSSHLSISSCHKAMYGYSFVLILFQVFLHKIPCSGHLKELPCWGNSSEYP